MDEEDQKEKIQRATHDDDDDDRSQTDHIPLDLTLEILSRLPAKSILKSRCVSKLWSSFTKLPSFISNFASRSSSRPPRLLVTLSTESNDFVFSFPQHQNPDGSYPQVYSESVQGLFLLQGFKIRNPSLRRLWTLPHPTPNIPSHDNWMSYLGFDPLEGKHKVLCVSHKESQQPRVITLGAQDQSWRIITKGVPRHCPISGDHGRCFNGILYYIARLVGVNDHPIIMSFDVKSEKFFKPIKYPTTYTRLSLVPCVMPYEGRLALVEYSINIDLYVSKDANGDEWTCKRFIRLPPSRERGVYLYFKGITDAGELVFAPCRVFESFYVLYFNPRRNSIREALFERIVGKEFRQRYGLSKKYTFKTTVFPNHIESLVSL
ncbi:hypothetical protein EUTSA_v10009752mg [Eutrema salsugineum]|uniref:F-box domain-containing protein n=1 Tax=Eutrema salsugineum TaxID=72664 RepID=V4K8S9_EUTSA|nr:putative F-box protein At1g50870 [Eutrema salsugineum]ESQ34010.1 hypothetical protein EUTSA_v10009752mg [Eutrema salsugineum]